MPKKAPESTAQLTFQVFCPPIITANGDGFTIKPGRPIVKLTARQLAAHFSVDRETIYAWRQAGTIPEEFVTFAGQRRLMFDAAVIPVLEAQFKARHD